MIKIEKSNYPTYFRLKNRMHSHFTNEVKLERAFCYTAVLENKIIDFFIVCDTFNDNKNYVVFENDTTLMDQKLMQQIFEKLELEYSSITISINSANKPRIEQAKKYGFEFIKETTQSHKKYFIFKKEL